MSDHISDNILLVPHMYDSCIDEITSGLMHVCLILFNYFINDTRVQFSSLNRISFIL